MLLPCLLLSSCGGEPSTTTDDGIYIVTFSVGDRKVETEVARGEIPICPEELLSWETEEHYYKVIGWDKEFVPADADTGIKSSSPPTPIRPTRRRSGNTG